MLLFVITVEEQHPPLLDPSPKSKEDVVDWEVDGRSRFQDRMECRSWVARFSSSSSWYWFRSAMVLHIRFGLVLMVRGVFCDEHDIFDFDGGVDGGGMSSGSMVGCYC